MTEKTLMEPKPVRLVFELSRADNPRLFEELVRFPQGAKRVNRLRVLAYDGLLAQYGVFTLASEAAALVSVRNMAAPESAALIGDVFGPGLAE
jgi:hypothetical protein